MPHVLIVDDEPTVGEVVATYLRRDGISTTVLAHGADAVTTVAELEPDLVVLDVMLPGANGFDILRGIRRSSGVPVIMLTARDDEIDRVAGLELGADDYVTKPFSPRELAARVRGVLRRARPPDPLPDVLTFGDLTIHPATRDVLVAGRPVELTAREFDLLCHLASSPRQVFSRGQLLRDVWDSSPDWQDPATVTVHIRRLRTKVEADPSRPRHLVTVRGAGYRFEP
ncbi:MAG: response regulator transcription factor [Acidimicrobiia bacterium]